MDEMTASISKHGVFQTVLVRPTPNGPAPYELVAGERRYLGSEFAGKKDIPCLIKEMTDAEAADIQLQENIQRKNLTQIEEAKKVQADLDELGSVEAVLEKHSKGRAWLSKILSLLTLPEQAKRLISEKISADMEVIGMVKTIEKINPTVARELVNNLKETRGKQDARKVAEKAKDVVKPPKKQGDKAMSKDHAHTQSGAAALPFSNRGDDAVSSSDDLVGQPDPELMLVILARAYNLIFESGSSPKMFLDTLSNQNRADVQSWLESFYDAGMNAENMALGLIQGLRNGTFATEGTGAFAMLAFVQGADAAIPSFNVLNILGLVKA
jgi:ParB family chromosome partitioning protein